MTNTAADEIKIDRGVPMPSHGNQKHPWRDMEVGDSFFIGEVNYYAVAQANRAYPPKKWTSRKVVENGVVGVRIWRTA